MSLMRSSRQIVVLIAGLASYVAPASRMPALERLLARAERRRVTERETGSGFMRWQRGVLGGCGLIEQARQLASAPLTRYGRVGRIESGWWAHAAPVHLRAGIADAVLEPVQGLTNVEFESLQNRLQEYLAALDAALWPAGEGAWLLQSQHALRGSLPPATEASGTSLRQLLTRGTVEPTLLRMLTELQMLLHQHPVNTERERRGLAPANGIWLWGSGVLPTAQVMQPGTSFRVVHDYLRGLGRWLGAAIDDPAGPEQTLAAAVHRIVVELTASEPGRLDEEWIAPLARGLARGDCSRLTLVLDDWVLELDAGSLRRFWRRRRTLEELQA